MAKEPVRLKQYYKDTVAPALMAKFGYKNCMAVPKIVKVTINMGVGEASQDSKLMDSAAVELTTIAGQKAVVTKSKKSIAGFKLRDNQLVGCKVDLRRDRMYEMLDRLITIALPRIRDFRGINPKSFDGRGNFNFGITEQIIFPEIDYDKVTKTRGMDICIVTSARTDEEGFELLNAFGFPFRVSQKQVDSVKK